MFELRHYQKSAIRAIFRELHTTNNVLVDAPVASGKTVMFTRLVEMVQKEKPNVRFLVLVNKNVLIDQTRKKFSVPVSVYSAGYGEKDLTHPIVIASVQSLANVENMPRFDAVCVDEVHQLRLDKGLGKKVYDKLFAPKVIGFTGTPFYPCGRPIWGFDEFFKRPPCYSLKMKDMVASGYLAPLKLAGQNDEQAIDVSNVKKNKHDYVILDLERAIFKSSDKVRLQVKDIIKRTLARKKVAVLCVSIRHAQYVNDLLKKENQKSVILHSKMRQEHQDKNKNEFMNGDVKFLISVLIISTGFDFPMMDAIAICRPTRSKVLFVQAVGRVLRTYPGKENGLVLDYGNIVPHLGHPYEIRASHTTIKQKISIKMCISCMNYAPCSSATCPECGTPFMVMCSSCFEMKKYGERCTCGSTRHRDDYKNLTAEISKQFEKHYIEDVKIYEYTAKSGRKMPRIDYYVKCVGFNRLLVSEFIFNQTLEQTKQRFKRPKFVTTRKNSKGYNEIVGKQYST